MKPVGEMQEEIRELTDECTMPFGKYKGYKMEDVPAGYLLWLSDESDNPSPMIVKYVNTHRTYLREEAENDDDKDYENRTY